MNRVTSLSEITEIINNRCNGQTWTPKSLASQIVLSYVNPIINKLNAKNEKLEKQLETKEKNFQLLAAKAKTYEDALRFYASQSTYVAADLEGSEDEDYLERFGTKAIAVLESKYSTQKEEK